MIPDTDLDEVEDLEDLPEEIPSSEKAEGLDEVSEMEEVDDLEEVDDITDNAGTEKTTEEPVEIQEVVNKDKTEEISATDESNNIEEISDDEVPEIIEIGDEDEEDLEDIFDNKDNVELLKVKKDDFLEIDQKPDELLPLEDESVSTNLEPIEEMTEEIMKNFTEPEELTEFEEPDLEESIDGQSQADADSDIPKIPEEFYVNNVINDELTKEIKKIERQKTSLQILLDDVYEKIGAKLMSLLIKLQTKDSFMQTFQKGFANNLIDRVELDGNNVIVRHIFTNERLIFISDIKKTKHLFQNIEFEKEYSTAQSLLIYPVKIFGKIRALLILAFETDVKENLEMIIKILEKNKENLRKNIMKLI
jgi:hypothetical protein